MATTSGIASEIPASTVLVVDAQRLFAEVLARRLREVPAIGHAQVAWSVDQARLTADDRTPDVVLLDPDLEGESGLDLVRHLAGLPGPPRVVVVSRGSDPSAVVHGLVLGVRGWVSKQSSFGDLLQAIDAVRRGDLHLPPAAWRPVVLQLLNERSTRAAQESFLGELTERQAQILRCLVAGMTRAEIAKSLKVSPHTVRTHLRDMFRIVGVHSTPHLVAVARAAGVTGAPNGASVERVLRDAAPRTDSRVRVSPLPPTYAPALARRTELTTSP
jgi:DNA-binding NarL/FixJ family response regulator